MFFKVDYHLEEEPLGEREDPDYSYPGEEEVEASSFSGYIVPGAPAPWDGDDGQQEQGSGTGVDQQSVTASSIPSRQRRKAGTVYDESIWNMRAVSSRGGPTDYQPANTFAPVANDLEILLEIFRQPSLLGALIIYFADPKQEISARYRDTYIKVLLLITLEDIHPAEVNWGNNPAFLELTKLYDEIRRPNVLPSSVFRLNNFVGLIVFPVSALVVLRFLENVLFGDSKDQKKDEAQLKYQALPVFKATFFVVLTRISDRHPKLREAVCQFIFKFFAANKYFIFSLRRK